MSTPEKPYYLAHAPNAVTEIVVPWFAVAAFCFFAAVLGAPFLLFIAFLGAVIVGLTGIGYAVHVWVWSSTRDRLR